MQRPYLDPALHVLWRTPDHVQVGLDPRHAYAFAAAPADTPALLRLLTGTNTWEALRHQARTQRSQTTLRRLIDLLDAIGLLRDGDPADRWQSAWVEVVGAGATAEATTGLLRMAGVGRVHLADTLVVPGPDLVVVAADRGRRMGLSEQLMAAGSPHLWCHLRDGRAVVGPLVRPGRTSCLRCQDLYRTDNDPAWPRLAVAWEEQPATHPAAAATVAGALCARQALAWLQGGPCATLDGTLEEQPDGSIVHEDWAPHPGCGCTWPDGAPSAADAV